MAWLTQKEVAAELKVSVKTLRNWRRAGKLPFARLGHRTIRISDSVLVKLRKENS